MYRTYTYTAKLRAAVHTRLTAFLEQQRSLYKAASAGGWVRKVDPKHTSQDCSRCGERVTKTLSDQSHMCPACGLSIDRDWNAALNILNQGLVVSPPTGGNIPCGTSGAENGSACAFVL